MTRRIVETIHEAVLEETEENARLAEQEWKRGAHGDGLSRFSADAGRESAAHPASGSTLQVRYVTRASERFELRNRLYQRIVELLQRNRSPQKTTSGRQALSSCRRCWPTQVDG